MERRRYAGPDDLRDMQRLTSRVWSTDSHWHVGDLAWERARHPEHEPHWPTQLWTDAGQVVAWGWAELPGDLSLQVDPAYPALVDEVLDWFDQVATGTARSVTVLSGERRLRATLTARGYRESTDGPYFELLVRDLPPGDRAGGLPTPTLPVGYAARTVDPSSASDVAGRVGAHRAAFHPAALDIDGFDPATVDSAEFRPDAAGIAAYRRVMATWPYRPDLDHIVTAVSGAVVAYCLLWLDAANRVALLEPVGTDPRYRRLGLARAVCLAGLHAARRAGAERAVVCPRGDAAYPIAGHLYRALGFEPVARTHRYAR